MCQPVLAAAQYLTTTCYHSLWGLDLANTTSTTTVHLLLTYRQVQHQTLTAQQVLKARYGIEIGGRPFLFGATDKPYSLFIGGNGPDADKFNPDVGGAELILNDGY